MGVRTPNFRNELVRAPNCFLLYDCDLNSPYKVAKAGRYGTVENRFDLLLVMPYGSCSRKAKMADENCLSLFDDDELRLEEVFGGNYLLTLQTRCVKLKQLKTTAKHQINAELDDGDISTFIGEMDESWLEEFSKLVKKCERDKLELLTTDIIVYYLPQKNCVIALGRQTKIFLQHFQTKT